jgi:hypothetical protein
MAEQWPFKPLVEGSSPPALILFQAADLAVFCWLSDPTEGGIRFFGVDYILDGVFSPYLTENFY